jgi:GTP-binding protein Era
MSRILGIAMRDECQIIFIDTPGFSRNRKIGSLEKITWDAFRETDNILFVIDVCKKNLSNSLALLKKIETSKKVSLVMNKIDLIHKPKLLELSFAMNQIRNFENIFMVSSISGSGVDKILDCLSTLVPEGEWIYGEDETTDLSFEKYTAEITREHVYHRIHQEVPYRCIVETESYQNKSDGSVKISQNIYVPNNAYKGIILGHNGGKIKAIGEAARKELSLLLEKKVHLFLQVVTKAKKQELLV